MPKKDRGWIAFQSSAEERTLLETYGQESRRSKTEVLRELVRGLHRQWQRSPDRYSTPSGAVAEKAATSGKFQVLGISTRNTLSGKVKQVIVGDISAEVAVKIAPGIEIVAPIARSSVERFGIFPGKQVCTVIKSSDVIIAVELEL